MKKVIIFDIGGTLMDIESNLFNEISKQINYNISSKQLENSFLNLKKNSINGNFKTIKEILNEISKLLEIENTIKFSNIYSDLYLNKIYLFDNVIETLNELLLKEYDIIAVSDADRDILIPQLKKLGIYKYFSKIIISSDVKDYKPGNEIINEIIKYTGINKYIYFIGDSKVDIETAKKIGATSILINTHHINRNYSQDITIENIKSLIKIL